MSVAISVQGLTIHFGKQCVLHEVSIQVERGEVFCLCGGNGAGKTTLVRAVLGLIPVPKNKVEIVGSMGYLPQRKVYDRRFPATVEDLLVAELRGGWPFRVSSEERDRVRLVLEGVDAEGLLDLPLEGLSVGQAQRVFLARALIQDPEILILDEPTAGVDSAGRAIFYRWMEKWKRERAKTIVLVTHHFGIVEKFGDQMVYLRDGMVYAQGPAQEVVKSRDWSKIEQVDHRHDACETVSDSKVQT